MGGLSFFNDQNPPWPEVGWDSHKGEKASNPERYFRDSTLLVTPLERKSYAARRDFFLACGSSSASLATSPPFAFELISDAKSVSFSSVSFSSSRVSSRRVTCSDSPSTFAKALTVP